MVEITLFEIHLENATFDAEATANAPLSRLFGGDEESEEETTDSVWDTESDSNGPPLGKILLVVALLGALAALAARLLDREDVDDLVEVAGEEIELESETTEREADD